MISKLKMGFQQSKVDTAEYTELKLEPQLSPWLHLKEIAGFQIMETWRIPRDVWDRYSVFFDHLMTASYSRTRPVVKPDRAAVYQVCTQEQNLILDLLWDLRPQVAGEVNSGYIDLLSRYFKLCHPEIRFGDVVQQASLDLTGGYILSADTEFLIWDGSILIPVIDDKLPSIFQAPVPLNLSYYQDLDWLVNPNLSHPELKIIFEAKTTVPITMTSDPRLREICTFHQPTMARLCCSIGEHKFNIYVGDWAHPKREIYTQDQVWGLVRKPGTRFRLINPTDLYTDF